MVETLLTKPTIIYRVELRTLYLTRAYRKRCFVAKVMFEERRPRPRCGDDRSPPEEHGSASTIGIGAGGSAVGLWRFYSVFIFELYVLS